MVDQSNRYIAVNMILNILGCYEPSLWHAAIPNIVSLDCPVRSRSVLSVLCDLSFSGQVFSRLPVGLAIFHVFLSSAGDGLTYSELTSYVLPWVITFDRASRSLLLLASLASQRTSYDVGGSGSGFDRPVPSLSEFMVRTSAAP